MSKPKRKSPSRKRIKYRSKFEGKVHEELLRSGITGSYEAAKLPYSLHLFYVPDWELANGWFLEAKGKFDYVERRKILAVVRDNPEVKIHMLFMRNNKLRKGSPETYGSWCDKNGISWSVFPDLPKHLRS